MYIKDFEKQTAPVFFQYHNENCFDKLIKIFNQGNWEINNQNNELNGKTENEWPDIVLTEKEKIKITPEDYEPYKIESLGEYIVENKTIKLYVKTILEMAKDYIKSKNYIDGKPLLVFITKDTVINVKEAFEIFTEIVLVHELAHWLMHVGYSKSFRKDHYQLINFHYTNKNEIQYHESFAQIFTNYFCATHSDVRYWTLFKWLEEKQPCNYKKYKELITRTKSKEDGKITGDDEKITRNDLTKLFDLFNFTRELELQSMEALINLSNNITYQSDEQNKTQTSDEQNKILFYITIIAGCNANLKDKLIELYPDYAQEIEFACKIGLDLVVMWHEQERPDIIEYSNKYKGKIEGRGFGI